MLTLPLSLIGVVISLLLIGGTITSTLLTLLVVPTFYDSIEITRDRAIAKFHRRAGQGNAFVAFVLTLLEALLALLLLRWVYRLIKTAFSLLFQRRSNPL